MNETYVTIRGRLVADPTARTTRAGVPMTTFRIASLGAAPGAGQPGQWEDAETSFYDVATYKVARDQRRRCRCARATRSPCTGGSASRSWQKDDGTTWWAVEVEADAVGHDLAFGTAAFAKVGRGAGCGGDGSAGRGRTTGQRAGSARRRRAVGSLGRRGDRPLRRRGRAGPRARPRSQAPARPGDDGRRATATGRAGRRHRPLVRRRADEAAA